MKKMKLVVSLLCLGVLFSCGSDDSDTKGSASTISEKTFGGTINDKSYTAIDGDGSVGEDLDGKELLTVRIAAQNFECNTIIFNEFDYVSVSIPVETKGVQKLNVVTIIQGASFGPSNNFEGLAEIVSLSKTEAVVKIKTESSFLETSYDLEGKFTVEICPEIEL